MLLTWGSENGGRKKEIGKIPLINRAGSQSQACPPWWSCQEGGEPTACSHFNK